MIPDLRSLRIPMQYLANLLSAGDMGPVITALERMLAMRSFKRSQQVDDVVDLEVLQRVGLTEDQVEEMYRYMAIADYEDRFVIPTSHKAYAEDAYSDKSSCGFSFGNGCSEGNSGVNMFGGKKPSNRDIIAVSGGEE